MIGYSCFLLSLYIVPSQFLEIDPESATACEVEPFSEFTLTCTVNILNPAVSIQRIDWRRTQGSATEDVIADGLSTVITLILESPVSTSALTVSGSEAGTYMYMCVGVLDNGEQYEEMAAAAVTIRGIRITCVCACMCVSMCVCVCVCVCVCACMCVCV